MNTTFIKYFYFFFFSLFLQLSFSQSSDNPWEFSLNSNLITLYGDNLESGINFGGPAIGISRHIGAGISLGTQYSLGNVKNLNDSYNYTSFDGFLKFNLLKGSITPYLIGGYGFSKFSDGTDRPGFFPSTETSRTVFGGLGFSFSISGGLSINLQSTFRNMNENDGFDHLQHIAGVNYSFGSGDADKDGVSDKKDKCPNVPGLKEYDGCPDTDGDTVIDKEDKCPEIPGKVEYNGCLDTDGDGISDPDDACVELPGAPEMNGCPDTDGDGVSDDTDNCIDEVGPLENNGCPWPDADNDGVADKDDLCKDEAGTIANNGCPELSDEIMKTINDRGAKINFAANSDKILGKKMRTILLEIRDILVENPKGNLLIEGYASADGSEDFNTELSVRRAETVRDFLVSLGISEERLQVKGLGETAPIGDNESPEGRAKNRRVQFTYKH